jgi:hypothetical protein
MGELKNACKYLRFEVLTAANMKMAVLPCSLVVSAAASTSETSVGFYQATRRNNPEDSHHHAKYLFENPKGRDQLGYLCADGKNILKCTLNK